MAYLNKKQYEYRANSAAQRNSSNEETAVENGMTEEQAEIISQLCGLRHELHSKIDRLVTDSDESLINNFKNIEEEAGENDLEFSFAYKLEEIDSLYYLPDYDPDCPEDHDSQEYTDWRDENYSRIYSEYEAINTSIEEYLKEIDEKYKTKFAPTGALRQF